MDPGLQFFYIILCAWVFGLQICLSTVYMPDVIGGQKRAWDLSELVWQAVVNGHVGARNQTHTGRLEEQQLFLAQSNVSVVNSAVVDRNHLRWSISSRLMMIFKTNLTWAGKVAQWVKQT